MSTFNHWLVRLEFSHERSSIFNAFMFFHCLQTAKLQLFLFSGVGVDIIFFLFCLWGSFKTKNGIQNVMYPKR
ncbi:hypothetical protein FHX64_000721 [Microbacter margulisiae]|uniref:Uncharacterized protein n=1 Tax=Microbacter margulisiae TaxID=1350067 RepID=A0A7W5H0H2_9PORP|nr:hypothetical protein [Microbacter margulisiae]